MRYSFIVLGVFLSTSICYGAPRERILIVGSTTVYPFGAVVAEHFARSGPFPTPEVRATSTAEGFEKFCAGAGPDTPDISNASRPISDSESKACAANGVGKVATIKIGYDSLIIANALAAPSFDITLRQLWRAAAANVPIGGRWVANPYASWHDIDAALPDRPIKLIGPSLGHGTRDTFVELVMEPSCRASLAETRPPSGAAAASCGSVRTDGRWIDVSNLELVLGKLASNRDAMGVLTYSYLDQFRNRVRAATIEGIAPSRETIVAGRYPLSRLLLIYVKEAHLKSVTGLADYAAEFLSFCAAGAHGYLADEGLVPLPAAELLSQRSVAARLQR
jgi:phosphate transport system substrate-binding protein